MDITINAKNHPNQERMREFYIDKLTRKFESVRFISSLAAKVDKDGQKDEYVVGLTANLIKGESIHAKDSSAYENEALYNAIKKLQRQLERYKELNYSSSRKNRLDKEEITP